MKSIFSNRSLCLALRVLLGGIFVTASISKIQAPQEFVNTVVGYGILPNSLARLYGWVVPWLEFYLGCSLLLGIFVVFASILSLPLVTSFVVASSYALVKDPNGVCGCFGNFINPSHPVSLAVDALMILASLGLLYAGQTEFLAVPGLFNMLKPKFKDWRRLARWSILLLTVAVLMTGVALASGVFSRTTPKETGTMAESIVIPEPFGGEVAGFLQAKQPVLIEVSSVGCADCEAAKPIMNELEADYLHRVAFLDIDYAAYTSQVQVMGVKSTPTVFLITGKTADGKFDVYRKYVTTVNKETVQEDIETALQLVH